MPRVKPGLSLSQLGFVPDSSNSSGGAPASPSQSNGRGPAPRPVQPGAMGGNMRAVGGADFRGRRPPPGRLGGIEASPFNNFTQFVDPSGKLNFEGKAIIGATGVNFSNGKSYKISMQELEVMEVLGRGQYGIVRKVFHKPTHVTMALKEIRLELSQRAFKQIIMELDILHKARSPYIVDFYGAFFIESCVYYCMEYMDYGSLDRLYPAGVPEDILANITLSVVKGLRFLKVDLNIIHRDVKPTNILVNKKGEVKLCDFGVSGELNQSLAKTHVGCQSYMAPERINGLGGPEGYRIQSDVWSLGLSIIEVATGSYPYDNGQFGGVFEQLDAIVNGEPPSLPEDKYTQTARDFVARCLVKDPSSRPTYKELLEHPWLVAAENTHVDMESWSAQAYAHSLALSNAANDTAPEMD